MRLITVRRDFTEGDCFPLFFFGDWHVGNASCAKGELHKDRDLIRDTRNSMYVNMGDNGDFIGREDRRFDARHLDEEIISLRDLNKIGDIQVDWLTEFERPIIDRCLVKVGSNHPNKFDRLHNTSVMERQLKALGKEDLWATAGALVRIVFTDKSRHACQVVLNVHHGTKMARYASTLLNQLLIKMRYWPQVDVMARGHCHYCRAENEQRMEQDRNFTRLIDRKIFVILTGGYLKTFREDGDNYAEDMDLDPIDIGMARLNVFPSRDGARLEVPR